MFEHHIEINIIENEEINEGIKEGINKEIVINEENLTLLNKSLS
jgi:hypothetical protein